jgi:hypothetical protein
VSEASVTAKPAAGMLGMSSALQLLSGEERLPLGKAAFDTYVETKKAQQEVLAHMSSTFLMGAAPMVGATAGGHYTGSDTEALNNAERERVGAIKDDLEAEEQAEQKQKDRARAALPASLEPVVSSEPARLVHHNENWAVLIYITLSFVGISAVIILGNMLKRTICLRSDQKPMMQNKVSSSTHELPSTMGEDETKPEV